MRKGVEKGYGCNCSLLAELKPFVCHENKDKTWRGKTPGSPIFIIAMFEHGNPGTGYIQC